MDHFTRLFSCLLKAYLIFVLIPHWMVKVLWYSLNFLLHPTACIWESQLCYFVKRMANFHNLSLSNDAYSFHMVKGQSFAKLQFPYL